MVGAGASKGEGGRRARRNVGWGRCGHALLLCLLIVGAGPSCRKGEKQAPADAGIGREIRRYTVRGEVVRLPDPAGRSSEIFVRHEAIDDFVGSDGRAVGMPSMVMPFAVPSPALVQDLSVGDKVEIRFKVDWSGPTLALEGARKLEPDTPLRFEPATSAAGGGRPRP